MGKKKEYRDFLARIIIGFVVSVGLCLCPAVQAWGSIIVKPNGEVSPGTTITITIAPISKGNSIVLEWVKDENKNGKADDGEKRLMPKTTITPGNTGQNYSAKLNADGAIEIIVRIAGDFPPGAYIIRSAANSGPIFEGYILEIVPHTWSFLKLLKEFVLGMPHNIKIPSILYCKDLSEHHNLSLDTGGTHVPTKMQDYEFADIASQLEILSIMNNLAPTWYSHLLMNTGRSIPGEKREEKGMYNLWLMDAATFTRISPLTDTGDCMNPTWSPDGKSIAYVRWIADVGELWLVSIDRDKAISSRKVLGKETFTGSIHNPVWYCQGDKIAFLSDAGLWVIKPDGTELKQLTAITGIRRILGWSIDSSRIVFSASQQDGTNVLSSKGMFSSLDTLDIKLEERNALEVWQVEIPSGKLERLVHDPMWYLLPFLSPDGKRMIFSIPVGEKGDDIWLFEDDVFLEKKRISEGSDPSISRDGTRLVFVSTEVIKQENQSAPYP